MFAYFVLTGLYQKMWCCLFCTSGTVPEDVVLSILYLEDCTRRYGVACLELRRLYQRVWCCLFGTSDTVTEDVCLFCTYGTVPEDVVLSILYFGDCTGRCGFAYFVLLGL